MGVLFSTLRRVVRVAWRQIKAIPRRVGMLVTLDAFGKYVTTVVGVAVLLFAMEYFQLL